MTAKARRLRVAMTGAEKKLWSGLRKDQLGVAFRRQHPIGKYVLDFYCASLGLVIELDGGHHEEVKQAGRDQIRTNWLSTQGLVVIRFWNNDVLTNLSGVLQTIRMEILKIANSKEIPTPSLPFPKKGGGRRAAPGGG